MLSVAGLGFCCVDYIGVVPHIPATDEKVQISKLIKQGGGVAGTAIVTVARLGAKTAIAWCVGDDDEGRFVISDLKNEGIDVSHLTVAPQMTTPSAYVLVDENTGKRTIAFYYDDMILTHLARTDLDWIKDAKVLYIDGVHEASIRAARIAKENGVFVICGTAEYAPEYTKIMELTDVFIASIDWARSLTGRSEPTQAARDILVAGPSIAVVTLGDQGSICVTKDKVVRKGAFHINVVDTTGAGDVYSGAFAYGLLREWPLDFVVEFANAVAAIKCEKLGGRAGIPNMNHVKAFLTENGIRMLGNTH